MVDVDDWRFNILRDDSNVRKWVLICVIAIIPVWFILGYDSGVGMIEEYFISGSKANVQAIYGRSFHFSSYVIYGCLFLCTSYHLRKVAILQTKNVIYAISFVALNVALFEFTYMALFNHYQLRRNLVSWFVEDFGFLSQYLILLLFGVYGTLLYATEKLKKTFSATSYFLIVIVIACFIYWVGYPLPVTTATFNGWTSNPLFPQTHYAYVNPTVYVANDLLHTVNLVAKSLFALTHLTLIRGFKREPIV